MLPNSAQTSERRRRRLQDREYFSMYHKDIVNMRIHLGKSIGIVQGWKFACNRWKEQIQNTPAAAPLLQEISESETALTALLNNCSTKGVQLASFQRDLETGWADLADRSWEQRREFLRDKQRELDTLISGWKEEVCQAFENTGFNSSETDESNRSETNGSGGTER
ncbi:hypothetical protein HRS9122_03392 [Pyrenophora teres f. teres]|nr:hypothetical protein HRS9122_03392 [Pyrenophora teres f. teres]